jgi:hypothetical protein
MGGPMVGPGMGGMGGPSSPGMGFASMALPMGGSGSSGGGVGGGRGGGGRGGGGGGGGIMAAQVTSQMSVAVAAIGSVIGKGGSNINQVRAPKC